MKYTIALAQIAPVFGDKQANLLKIEQMVEQARGADLLVFPEMATTGYMVQSREELMALSEPIPTGETVRQLSSLAKLANMGLVVGMPEIDQEKLYSSAVVVTPDGYVGKLRKNHLFLNESNFFDRGDSVYQVYLVKGVRIGVGICYEYMFPEIWRTLALKGAQIFCVPVNLISPYCFPTMHTRALENGVFAVTVNRTGDERGQHFSGGSEIVAPKLRVLATASSDKEEVIKVKINPDEALDKKINSINDVILDRRPELYEI